MKTSDYSGDYYLGFDCGTSSVGWSVTDINYNVLEFAKYIFEMIVLITIICIVIPIKRLSNIEPSKGLRFFGE